MSNSILVINPNSNEEVTQAIDVAMEPLRTSDAPTIECITLAAGPQGVEMQADVDLAAPLATNAVASRTDRPRP